MTISKKYFQDRVVLALLSVNAFLAFAATFLIVVRLDGSSEDTYTISYRSNLGLDGFTAGSMSYFACFVLLSIFVLLFHSYLSMRLYEIRKLAALAVLVLAVLLLSLIIIVTNALFVLQ